MGQDNLSKDFKNFLSFKKIKLVSCVVWERIMRLKSEDYMRKDRMWTYYKRIYNLTRSNGENATGPWWEKTMLAHAKCHLQAVV